MIINKNFLLVNVLINVYTNYQYLISVPYFFFIMVFFSRWLVQFFCTYYNKLWNMWYEIFFDVFFNCQPLNYSKWLRIYKIMKYWKNVFVIKNSINYVYKFDQNWQDVTKKTCKARFIWQPGNPPHPQLPQ